MALNPDPVGAAIANIVSATAPSPDQKITAGQLTDMWKAIIKVIYDDLKLNAGVNAGTFSSPSGPVTGVGGPLV